MPGFGDAPWGSALWGFGSITSTDPRQTKAVIAREIDAITGDYVAEERGFAGMSPVKQQVMIALGSVLGSGGAVPKVGMFAGGKIDSKMEARVSDQIRRQLYRLTNITKTLRIERIRFTVEGSRVTPAVDFVDLTRPQDGEQTVSAPVR
jgi:hypothetical protein